MYSRTSWGGPVDPYILIKFTDVGKEEEGDPAVSLVVFEWKDEDFIGVLPSPDSMQKIGICQQPEVDKGYCNSTDIGEFILSPNATEKSNNIIFTKAVHLKDSSPINYPIKKTGYYCVLTESFGAKQYSAVVEFRNAFGELPATQIPKLPFYGGITILYALVLVCVPFCSRPFAVDCRVLTCRRFWGFLYFQHRSDICRLNRFAPLTYAY
jgi:hypothetical protein